MGGFCQHCGKELNGDEPYCPECGMPTETVQPVAASPRKSDIKIAVAFVAAVAVLCIIGIALLPSLINNTSADEYNVTLTVDNFAIYLDDTSQYTDIASDCRLVLSLTYEYAGKTVTDQISVSDHYKLNDGVKPSTAKSSVKITGDPKDVKITAFLLITGPGWHTEEGPFYDYIDIYSVDKSKITEGSSLYYGDSGVAFTLDELVDDKFEMVGDSDPKGIVNITVTAVKIQ